MLDVLLRAMLQRHTPLSFFIHMYTLSNIILCEHKYIHIQIQHTQMLWLENCIFVAFALTIYNQKRLVRKHTFDFSCMLALYAKFTPHHTHTLSIFAATANISAFSITHTHTDGNTFSNNNAQSL